MIACSSVLSLQLHGLLRRGISHNSELYAPVSLSLSPLMCHVSTVYSLTHAFIMPQHLLQTGAHRQDDDVAIDDDGRAPSPASKAHDER